VIGSFRAFLTDACLDDIVLGSSEEHVRLRIATDFDIGTVRPFRILQAGDVQLTFAPTLVQIRVDLFQHHEPQLVNDVPIGTTVPELSAWLEAQGLAVTWESKADWETHGILTSGVRLIAIDNFVQCALVATPGLTWRPAATG